jgi:hypothetical protein
MDKSPVHIFILVEETLHLTSYVSASRVQEQ